MRTQPIVSHVVFSSTSAMLGLARSSDYAGSNAYLEALTHVRALVACACTHTAWGAVANVGLSSRIEITVGRIIGPCFRTAVMSSSVTV